jgi:hypothetical protein
VTAQRDPLIDFTALPDDLGDVIDGLGMRLAIDDETVAGGLYSVARAIDRFTDTYARVAGVAPSEPRPEGNGQVFGPKRT